MASHPQRAVSIIGSGQAGMVLAHHLIGNGHEVTLYSDRTASQWLNEARPTGVAYLFAETLDIERELGINHWSNTMREGGGAYIKAVGAPGSEPMTVIARSTRPGAAVDQRMKMHKWMLDFEARGGRIVHESVTPERAIAIAAASELTILAAGKADLSRLIPRDDFRSVYSAPARRLAAGIVRNAKGWRSEIDFDPIKFSALGPLGEIFWVPFTHKTEGHTWAYIVEARPGSPLDSFGDCKTGEQLVEFVRGAVRQFAPWDYEAISDMEYIAEDPYSWLVGAFPPTVRHAFGRLPNGTLLMPLGDTAITFDPIGGQGGNNATRNAKFVGDAILRHGDKKFDEAWMTKVFEDYWAFHGGPAYRFNNLFLEPTPALAELLAASARDPRIADEFIAGGQTQPKKMFPWLNSLDSTAQRLEAFRRDADTRAA
jgi:hypothetical protein